MRRTLQILFLLISIRAQTQTASSYAVMVQAKIVDTNAVRLSWDEDATAFSISVYRKALTDQSWGVPIASLGGTDTGYTDMVWIKGLIHEYRVVRSTSAYTAYGYVVAGSERALEVYRGDALLIVESEIDSLLQSEIESLVLDMEADGWRVTKYDVSQDTTVPYVKSLITSAYGTLPQLKLVYILGHVPVPYSGNLAPDGHTNHVGAWPADVYYAEMNDLWTDQSINNTSASQVRNQNIPGDGKFDQSVLPGNSELMIGRVDFHDLPVFSVNEVELTRRYLNKVHAYKNGENKLEKRAVIDDNFGAFGGEAFASNGWRNFSPIIGRDNISTADYRTSLNADSYLFSYGCGGGSFTSASGIGTSADFAGDSLQTGFTMLFGSYFGDWDSQNNFMRSALAQGNTMSISWAGRPHWQYHTLAMGYPVGYSGWKSQNNASLYTGNYAMRGVHVALLGDPTLRMEYIAPPTAVQADSVDTFHITISWTASADAVDGYNIYKSQDGSPFYKLNDLPITGTNYIDSCVLYQGVYTYMVKSTRLTENFSGSYWNESLGSEDSIQINSTKNLTLDFKVSQLAFYGLVLFEMNNSTRWASIYYWIIDGDTINDAIYMTYPDTLPWTYHYSIYLSNSCQKVIDSKSYFVNFQGVNLYSDETFKTYPNPISRGQTLIINSIEWIENVIILSNDGRVVYQFLDTKNLIIPEIASGVYLIKIEATDAEYFSKLIIE